MWKFLLLLFIATPVVAQESVMSRDSPAHPEAAKVRAVSTGVTRVIDGDTFAIDRMWTPWRYLSWNIRSRGIDTPEKGYTAKCQREKDLGHQATEFVERLMREKGGRVLIKNIAFDKYGGRLVADVFFRDGTSMNAYLIDSGLGAPYSGSGPKPDWCSAAMIGERG